MPRKKSSASRRHASGSASSSTSSASEWTTEKQEELLQLSMLALERELKPAERQKLEQLKEEERWSLPIQDSAWETMVQRIEEYSKNLKRQFGLCFLKDINQWIEQLPYQRSSTRQQMMLRQCYCLRALFYQQQGREFFQQAFDDYQQYVALCQQAQTVVTPDFYYHLGLLAVELQKWSEGQQYLERYLQEHQVQSPLLPLLPLYAGLGIAYLSLDPDFLRAEKTFTTVIAYAREESSEKVAKWRLVRISCYLQKCQLHFDANLLELIVLELSDILCCSDNALDVRWEVFLRALSVFEAHPSDAFYHCLASSCVLMLEANPKVNGIVQLMYLVYYGYVHGLETERLYALVLHQSPRNLEAQFWRLVVETSSDATVEYQLFWRTVAAENFYGKAYALNFFNQQISDQAAFEKLVHWIAEYSWRPEEIIRMPEVLQIVEQVRRVRFPEVAIMKKFLEVAAHDHLVLSPCNAPTVYKTQYDILLALTHYLSFLDTDRSERARVVTQQIMLFYLRQVDLDLKASKYSDIYARFFALPKTESAVEPTITVEARV